MMRRTIIAFLGLLACAQGAKAYEFSISNNDTQPIEIAVAYDKGIPENPEITSIVRVIDGFIQLQPGETKTLFDYKIRAKDVWLSVKTVNDGKSWVPLDKPTFSLSGSLIKCNKSVCTVSRFPGFIGLVKVRPKIIAHVLGENGVVDFVKIENLVKKQNSHFNWPAATSPGETPPPAPTPIPVPPPSPAPPAPTPTPSPTPSLGLKVCNRTPDTIQAAFGLLSKDSESWTAQGWYVVAPGTCEVTLKEKPSFVYGYAVNAQRTREWSPGVGQASFCVNPAVDFNLSNEACATDPSLVLTTFGILNGNDTWTLE